MISMFYIRLPLVPAKLDNLIGMPRDFLTELCHTISLNGKMLVDP